MKPNTLTVLTHKTHPLTKTWKTDGTIESYGRAKTFQLTECEVDNIRQLSEVLIGLESDPHSAVIRGDYIGERRRAVLRQKEFFADVPRHYMMVDADSYQTRRDWRVDPVGAVREYIETALPPIVHGVSFHWQLSSTAGHPSKGDDLRVHVWVWLHQPHNSAALRRWAKHVDLQCDHALFDSIQLHYTAAPVFEEGVDDPIKQRSGFAEGDFGDVVFLSLPDDFADESNGLISRRERIGMARAADRVVTRLREREMIKGERRDGGFNVKCPRSDQHTGESGESSTTYYPAHTGGFKHGSFVCLHSHCRDNQQSAFMEALGFDELDGVFVSEDRTIQLVDADGIVPKPIHWLMPGWLAAGKLVLLAGSPGTGKTTIAMSFAGTLTSGGKWPDGTQSEPGTAVVWSGEDDPTDTLAPRLHACGADLSRVKFVGDAFDDDGRRPFDPAKDMPLLLKAIEGIGEACRLIIVDPIVSAVAGDSHKNAEVRRGLQPLVDLAAKLNATLIGVTHFTKGTSGKDTTERVTGSLAFAALARIVLATARDTEAGDFVLTRSKSNIGPDGGGFRYQLAQIDLPRFPGVVASRVEWGETLEGNARELIADAEGESKPKDGSPVDEWLRNLLSLGPVKATEVCALGGQNSYGERRLQRALKKIGGYTEKEGFRGVTWWRLPGDSRPLCEILKGGDGIADDGEL